MPKRYSQDDLKAVVALAADHDAAADLSEDELLDVCRAVGLEGPAVVAAIAQVARRGDRRRALVGAVVLVSAVGGALAFGREGIPLALHNERSCPVEIEVFVPRVSTACSQASRPPRASDYCRAALVQLQRDERSRVDIRDAERCPWVWVRSDLDSVTFRLPASVELEHDGVFDEKGLGAPSKFTEPLIDERQPEDCRGAS